MDNDRAMIYTSIACQGVALLACWLGQMQYVYGALLWAILATLIRICWKLDKCDWKPWYETEEGKKQLLDIINEKYAFMKDGTIIPRKEWEMEKMEIDK